MPFDSHFIQYVYASELVDQAILDQITGRLRRQGHSELHARQLADELLHHNLINSWQLSQLLEGRTKFTLGHYTIVDSLGQGGYGQVFLARPSKIHSEDYVAVKVLPAVRSTPEIVARFNREIRLQSGFDHPNLIQLLDAGEDGNAHFAVHEYMDAGDARRKIRRELQLSIENAVQLVINIAEALAWLHEHGLIHRDVKPANILLNQKGTFKLADFGFCCTIEPDLTDGNSRYGKLVGTADYMAPDHILNPKVPSPLWDIYSLGCTFYQAVTGLVPFPKGDSRQKILAHVRYEPMDARIFRQDFPHELAAILAEMMEKNPEKRTPGARIVAEKLGHWLATERPFRAMESQQSPRHVDTDTFQEVLDFATETHLQHTRPGQATEDNDTFQIDALDLGELKSETLDMSSSQCLVMLPGHEEPVTILAPPVFDMKSDQAKKSDSFQSFPIVPVILGIMLLMLIGIFLILLTAL